MHIILYHSKLRPIYLNSFQKGKQEYLSFFFNLSFFNNKKILFGVRRNKKIFNSKQNGAYKYSFPFDPGSSTILNHF